MESIETKALRLISQLGTAQDGKASAKQLRCPHEEAPEPDIGFDGVLPCRECEVCLRKEKATVDVRRARRAIVDFARRHRTKINAALARLEEQDERE